MADRTLVHYEEVDPYPYVLDIERAASGHPTLLITLRDPWGEEHTIVVNNADLVLTPAIKWAADRRAVRAFEHSEGTH